MLGVLLAAVTAPQPSPTPLKTITHVRSSPFCTALRKDVGFAVKALIENNVAIVNSKTLFLRMAHDRISSPYPMSVIDLDVQRLGPQIDTIARNLEALQAKLNEAQLHPPAAGSEDARRLSDMERQLRTIADKQNEALNVLSGTYFSYNGNRLLREGDGPGSDAPDDAMGEPDRLDVPIVAPSLPPPENPAPSQSSPPASASASGSMPKSVDLGLAGSTKFAELFNSLTDYQVVEQPLETQAAKTILDAAAQCR